MYKSPIVFKNYKQKGDFFMAKKSKKKDTKNEVINETKKTWSTTYTIAFAFACVLVTTAVIVGVSSLIL